MSTTTTAPIRIQRKRPIRDFKDALFNNTSKVLDIMGETIDMVHINIKAFSAVNKEELILETTIELDALEKERIALGITDAQIANTRALLGF